MALDVQDHVVDEVIETGSQTIYRNGTERDMFHTIENIGRQAEDRDWKQRTAAVVLALVISAALYGVLYLALHLHE